MPEIASGWQMDVWDAEGWTCARISNERPSVMDTPPLAEQLWGALGKRSSVRLVLDLSGVPLLYSYLVGQLVLLHKRLGTHNGELRLCGLSAGNHSVLHIARLDEHFPCYADLAAALRGPGG